MFFKINIKNAHFKVLKFITTHLYRLKKIQKLDFKTIN